MHSVNNNEIRRMTVVKPTRKHYALEFSQMEMLMALKGEDSLLRMTILEESRSTLLLLDSIECG